MNGNDITAGFDLMVKIGCAFAVIFVLIVIALTVGICWMAWA